MEEPQYVLKWQEKPWTPDERARVQAVIDGIKNLCAVNGVTIALVWHDYDDVDLAIGIREPNGQFAAMHYLEDPIHDRLTATLPEQGRGRYIPVEGDELAAVVAKRKRAATYERGEDFRGYKFSALPAEHPYNGGPLV